MGHMPSTDEDQGTVTMLYDDVRLSLRDDTLPSAETDEERTVCQMLRERKACKRSELITELADKMYKNELKHGAWAVDIGLAPTGSRWFADSKRSRPWPAPRPQRFRPAEYRATRCHVLPHVTNPADDSGASAPPTPVQPSDPLQCAMYRRPAGQLPTRTPGRPCRANDDYTKST